MRVRQALDTEAVPFSEGLVVIGVGIVLFTLIESENQMRLRIMAMHAGSGAAL